MMSEKNFKSHSWSNPVKNINTQNQNTMSETWGVCIVCVETVPLQSQFLIVTLTTAVLRANPESCWCGDSGWTEENGQKDGALGRRVGGLFRLGLGRLPFILISEIGVLMVDIWGWMLHCSTGFRGLHKYHGPTPKWQVWVVCVTITVVRCVTVLTLQRIQGEIEGISIQEQRTEHQPSFWPLWTISFGCKPIRLWGQRELCLFFNGSNFEGSHWSWP